MSENRCPQGDHMAIVVFRRRIRDGFRKTYWVCCWKCDFQIGPCNDRRHAQITALFVDRYNPYPTSTVPANYIG